MDKHSKPTQHNMKMIKYQKTEKSPQMKSHNHYHKHSGDNDSHDTHSTTEDSVFNDPLHDSRHHHSHFHKQKHQRFSTSSTFIITSSSSSSTSATSSSSSFSSSSSSSSPSSCTASSSSSSSSSNSDSESSNPHVKSQHSSSCTDISKKNRYFDECDDTAPLLEKGEYVDRNKKQGSTPGSIQGKPKIVQDESVRKAKSMESLARPKQKLQDKAEQDKRKNEAKKNIVKEKIQFSAFLNEITRQVLSPMRLTTLGVTNAKSSGQAKVRSTKSENSKIKLNLPGSGDSASSGKQSQSSSKHSHSHQRHYSHHSVGSPDCETRDSFKRHHSWSYHHCSCSPSEKHHYPRHHHRYRSPSNEKDCHNYHNYRHHHSPTYYHNEHQKTSRYHTNRRHRDTSHRYKDYGTPEHGHSVSNPKSCEYRDTHPSHSCHLKECSKSPTHSRHHSEARDYSKRNVTKYHHRDQHRPALAHYTEEELHHKENHHTHGYNHHQHREHLPLTDHYHGFLRKQHNKQHGSDHDQDLYHQSHHHHGDHYHELHHHQDHHTEHHHHHHGDHHREPHHHGESHTEHHHHGDRHIKPHHHHGDHHNEPHYHGDQHHGDHHNESHQHGDHYSESHHHHHGDHHSKHHYQDDHNSEPHCHGDHHNEHYHQGDHNSGPQRHGDHHNEHHHHRDHHSEPHHHGDHHSEHHHQGEHNSEPHHYGDHHNEHHHQGDHNSEPHRHGDHCSETHHHGDHHSEHHHKDPHHHHHGDNHKEPHYHGDYHYSEHHSEHHNHHGDYCSELHHLHEDHHHDHNACRQKHLAEHCCGPEFPLVHLKTNQCHTGTAHHEKPAEKTLEFLRNSTRPASASSQDEEQTSFSKENADGMGRIIILHEQNDGLQQSLLKTAVRVESLGEEFTSSHHCLEAEIQKSRLELSNLTERFKRLHDNCSSTQQTNSLLEHKLHLVTQSMEGERERLNKRISALTERQGEAKFVNTVDTSNATQHHSHSGVDPDVPPIAPPPAQFMDNLNFPKDKAVGQEQPLGSVPEEEESDWSEIGEETPRFVLTGLNRGQAWRHRGSDEDKANEQEKEEIFEPNSSRSSTMPHLQFKVHDEILPLTQSNLSNIVTCQNSYRITTSPSLGSAVLVRSASLEEIPMACHTTELQGTEAMTDLHYSAVHDSDNELIHHLKNSSHTVHVRQVDSSVSDMDTAMSNLQSAEHILNHLISETQHSEVEHSWSEPEAVSEKLLKGERTKL